MRHVALKRSAGSGVDPAWAAASRTLPSGDNHLRGIERATKRRAGPLTAFTFICAACDREEQGASSTLPPGWQLVDIDGRDACLCPDCHASGAASVHVPKPAACGKTSDAAPPAIVTIICSLTRAMAIKELAAFAKVHDDFSRQPGLVRSFEPADGLRQASDHLRLLAGYDTTADRRTLALTTAARLIRYVETLPVDAVEEGARP